jgi:copper transport protein
VKAKASARRLACCATALVGLLLAAPQFASAHAILLDAGPANSTVVQKSPAEVVLHFNESVETALGSVRVYDARGQRVDSGRLTRPRVDTVAVGIERPLSRGTYTVTWRVISADTHPVHGAYVFSVGAASANAAAIAARVIREQATPALVSKGFGVVRFISFALLLGLVGGTLALAFTLRGIDRPTRLWLTWLLTGTAVGLVIVSLVGIVFEGASAGGFSLRSAAQWSVVEAVCHTRFGHVWLARAALAAIIGVVLALSARSAERGALIVAAALAVVLAATPTLAGHASIGGPVDLVVDIAHVLAAAIWIGGLLFVALALVHIGPERRWVVAGEVLPRFSNIALGSVVVLLGAGIVNSYLEVRAWRGLWGTTYGQLLLVKVALLLPLLAIGAYNRNLVRRLRLQTASSAARRTFKRAVTAELTIFVAVLAVTAVLVSEAPAKSQILRTGPYAATTSIGPYELNLIVDPAKAGPNSVHLYVLSRVGQPVNVAEANVSATLPERGIGPLRFPTHLAGPGHYIVSGASIGIAGKWRFEFTVRRGAFDEWTASLPVPIGGL